jgi:hypothetical protein
VRPVRAASAAVQGDFSALVERGDHEVPTGPIQEQIMTITTTMSEYETGTYTGHVHPHNGYYAGDFGPRGTCSMTRPASNARVTAAHKTLARVASLPRR